MNKIISKIITIGFLIYIILSSVFVLYSCSTSYSIDETDECVIGYNKKNAFIGYVKYDLDTKEIYLPSEYNDVLVEDLGGYYGRGVPTPFFLAYTGITEGFSTSRDEIDSNDTVIEVNIDIYLPKYLKKCSNIRTEVTGYYEGDHSVIFIAKCNYYIDNSNEYFYTKNGKLYNKSNDTLVDNLIYQDNN